MGRTLALTQNTTLDARADMLGDWFDPADQDPEIAAETQRLAERSDAILLGRATFEAFRAFWPQQTDDTTGVAEHLDRVQKYVVSSTLTDPGWQRTTVLTGDLIENVRKLKAAPGGDIVCTGSVQLAHALLSAGLVDEVRLFTYPVVQGDGRRVFPDGWSGRFDLCSSRTFEHGVTLSVHRLTASRQAQVR